MTAITWVAAAISMVVLVFLVLFVLIQGVGNFSPDLFALEYTSDNGSLMPALFNTVFMVILSLIIAAPLGIFAAIFLVEYSSAQINLSL